MTVLAEHLPERIASDDVADQYPMPRNVRVDDRTWEAFAESVGSRRRSTWLIRFMQAVNHNPQLWREFEAIANARGETFAAALEKALQLYRAAG